MEPEKISPGSTLEFQDENSQFLSTEHGMNPIPETKTSRLIEELNALVREERLNDFALARIRKEAEALLPYDKDGAFMVLGAVSGLLGDEKAMHRYHSSSLDYAVDKAEAYFNYATSLIWVENFSGALEVLQISFELERSPTTLNRMAYCSMQLGLSGLTDRFCREYEKLTGESFPEKILPSFTGAVREDIMDILDKDIADHGDLWKGLAKV
ncbi:tetratricopeptide repeat protein [Solidesulfovibrio sp.]